MILSLRTLEAKVPNSFLFRTVQQMNVAGYVTDRPHISPQDKTKSCCVPPESLTASRLAVRMFIRTSIGCTF